MPDWLRASITRHETMLGAIVLLIGLVFALWSPQFLNLSNLGDLLESYSVMAIMAAGLFMVLIGGGIDISFAGIAAVSQYATALVITQWSGNWLTALALALLFGAALGLLNALLIHFLEAMSVIVTIATMSFYFSILLYLTKGVSIYDLPDWFTTSPFKTGPFRWLDFVAFPVLVAALCLLLTWLITKRLALGRQIYALGGNFEAAKRMGCNILGLRCFIFGFSGAMSGIAGIIQAHRVQEVVPNALIGRELDVLAACVLGGASLLGGIGTVSGIILGIVLLAMLQNGLTLVGVSSYDFGIVTGLVILASVSATALGAKRREKTRVRHAI